MPARRQPVASSLATASIPQGTEVLVLKVPDGVESDGKIGSSSGTAVVWALRQELLRRGMTPFTSDEDTLADGLRRAATRSDDYVLRTRIIMWEDNLTEWSMTPGYPNPVPGAV